jgi:hypothetical protein
MSKIIEVLEKLGQDARLRHARRSEIAEALMGANIDPEIQVAILGGDQQRLEALLGADTNVCCMIFTPQQEEDDDRKSRKAKEDDKETVGSAETAGRHLAAAV